MTGIEALSGVSEKLVKALPPAMVVLVVLNLVVLGFAVYVFGHNVDARNVMLSRIIDSCLSGSGNASR